MQQLPLELFPPGLCFLRSAAAICTRWFMNEIVDIEFFILVGFEAEFHRYPNAFCEIDNPCGSFEHKQWCAAAHMIVDVSVGAFTHRRKDGRYMVPL